MAFKYKSALQGHGKSDVSRHNFVLSAANSVDAILDADQIRGSYVDITKAFVASETISNEVSSSTLRPADTSADTFEQATIIVYMNGGKLGVVNVHAPIEALFLPDGETVDTSNALLIQYIQQLSQHSTMSDGDTIDTSILNGIKEGYKTTLPRKFKSK